MAKRNVLTHSKKKKAELCLRNNNLLEARQLYAAICQADRVDGDAWIARCALDLQLGDYQSAEAGCRHLQAIGIVTADSHYLLGCSLEGQGRLNEALAAYTAAVRDDPAHTDASSRRAMALQALNRIDEAASCYRRAIELRPNDAVLHYNLGVVLNQLGRPDEAEVCYQKAVRLNPHDARAFANLGYVQRAQKKFGEAVESYTQAATLDPGSAEIQHNFGLALRVHGRLDDAIARQQTALEVNPVHEDAFLEIANIHATRGDQENARLAYRHALAVLPDSLRLLTEFAGFLQGTGEYHEALDHYKRALQLQPQSAATCHDVGALFASVGMTEQAIFHFRKALHIDPDFAPAYVSLGLALLPLGMLDEAEACGIKARELQPDNLDAIGMVASVLERRGQTREAHALIEPYLAADILHPGIAGVYALTCKAVNQRKDATERLSNTLDRGGTLLLAQRCNLHFGLGKLLDDTGDYDNAFAHYEQANKMHFAEYRQEEDSRLTDTCITLFSADFLRNAPHSSTQSDKPIFIVGMPRSGTSLVEQILSTHPGVYGAGELTAIDQFARHLGDATGDTYPQSALHLDQATIDAAARQYLAALQDLAPSAIRVTDKMPGNFLHLGLIQLLFPGARVIHCRRDPLDTCLSCYFQQFNQGQTFSYDLSDLGHHYRQYQRLMRHWQSVISLPMLDVHYEDLVADQEAMSRKMLEFCGLDWTDECMRFYESKRYVATASYDQVRQPIYHKSVGRWRHYERYLGPLKTALGDLPVVDKGDKDK